MLPAAVSAQHRLRPYAGLHGSGDAQMYYLGPSGQIGADYRIKDSWGLTTYGHYFRRRIDRKEANNQFEKASFDCLTGAVLVQFYFGGKPNRGFFAGAGVAVQRVEDDFVSDWNPGWYDLRSDVLPAIRFGYAFPVGSHQLTAELNATGPYQERTVYYTHTELITQLSVGTRFIW
ncbi:hypothetical protein BEN47_07655 [Hymenobacter lapidarius]|uniref:Outer membrane protein beta-barrel domain-containing protein n=1 Tax=Hymenobacter lapidarius TaxID=1908237 RepID=A0A1G1TEI3_9BACT|nr:hypothetical protein [Hymenobacter lapidarius]OGX89265.1 hypothetical protein BEN47_07655 [Hymenobacter lapidarius]